MKKLVSVLLSTIMLMSTLPFVYAADESDAWKENTGVINLDNLSVSGEGISIDATTVIITKGGDFEVRGTLSDGMIYVKTDDKVKLRLSGASITNTQGPAIFFDNVDKGFITITENTENYLQDAKEYSVEEADAALFSNDDLEIKGQGKLNIIGNYKHGIAGDDDVTIENGVINIQSYEHGIKVNDTLSVTGGKITVTAETGKGMKADLEVIIDGGEFDITSLTSEGIESKGIFTVNGGKISVKAADDGFNTGNPDTDEDTYAQTNNGGTMNGSGMMQRPRGEFGNTKGGMTPQIPENGQMPQGPGGKYPQPPTGETEPVVPTTDAMEEIAGAETAAPGQTVPQGMPGNMAGGRRWQGGGNGGGFGRIDEETAAAHALTINGGEIYINANGDGIDSNGNLTINGGTIIVDGPLNRGNGSLDSDGTMSITGGMVITASSAGMMQLPRNEEGQNILTVYFTQNQAAQTQISITETQSGEEVVSHTPAVPFQTFVFSSDKIVEGNEYTIYVNGEKYESTTAAKGSTTVGSTMNNNRPGGNNNFLNNRNSRVRVSINGQNVRFNNTNPVIKEGTTLVEFRAILEALGAEVTWDEETRTVTAKKEDVEIVMNIGSKTATVNGEEKTLLLAPEIINDSTMIPVRFVSENLHMDVEWDETFRLITVRNKQKAAETK